MSEEDLTNDFGLKKKKKKKITFDPDALVGGGDEQPPAATHEPAQSEPVIEDPLDVDEDFSKMSKKKKKKKPIDLDELTDGVETMKVSEGVKEEPAGEGEDVGIDAGIDLDFGAKKKKKKKVMAPEAVDGLAADTGVDSKAGVPEDKAWEESDRDYTYDELLKRVFDIMREKNPDMVAGEKRRFVMKPPQVMRVGTKKTSFANFAEICKMLHRQPKHLLAFLLAELGTSGSLDGNSQLIIKGRFQQKQLETVLRAYIKEYVTCHTCRSPDTILQKDTRLYFLQCETCGSRCSVTSIKSGFQAVTGKRAAIRAKTT